MQIYDFTVPELDRFRELCNFSDAELETDEAVYIAMSAVCKEIKEFVQTLYSGTDTPKERELIKQMIKEIQ